MKIRNDFVTNSSSSSFILGFTNDDVETIRKELFDRQPGSNEKYLNIIIDDVLKANKLNKNEIVKYLKEYEWLELECTYRTFYEKYETDDNNLWEFLNTKTGKKIAKKKVSRFIRKILNGDKEIFVVLEYGNDVFENNHDYKTNVYIECDVLPNNECTVIDISHH